MVEFTPEVDELKLASKKLSNVNSEMKSVNKDLDSVNTAIRSKEGDAH